MSCQVIMIAWKTSDVVSDEQTGDFAKLVGRQSWSAATFLIVGSHILMREEHSQNDCAHA